HGERDHEQASQSPHSSSVPVKTPEPETVIHRCSRMTFAPYYARDAADDKGDKVRVVSPLP
ncbi:MAG TPA: hypothetical protein VLM79_40895, partial [Kofleriaceae bacterium]|nr:hypothetical protein [Kofleriaceae bacterium]